MPGRHSPRNAMVLSPVRQVLCWARFTAGTARRKPSIASVRNSRSNRYVQLQDHQNVIPNQLPPYAFPSVFPPNRNFSTHVLRNCNTIELPSSRRIDLHAACAKISHASSAAERLRETFRDTVTIPVMTAADELFHVLTNVRFQ